MKRVFGIPTPALKACHVRQTCACLSFDNLSWRWTSSLGSVTRAIDQSAATILLEDTSQPPHPPRKTRLRPSNRPMGTVGGCGPCSLGAYKDGPLLQFGQAGVGPGKRCFVWAVHCLTAGCVFFFFVGALFLVVVCRETQRTSTILGVPNWGLEFARDIAAAQEAEHRFVGNDM